MCAEPCTEDWNVVGECEVCGADINADGDAIDICCHSPEECEVCGFAPCDQSC